MTETSLVVTERTSSIQSMSDLYRSYSFVGIGCGFHKSFDLICVMDLAGSYEDHLEMLQNRGGDRRTKQLPNQGNPAPQPSNRNTFYDSPRKQQGDAPNSMNASKYRVDKQQGELEPKHMGKRIESNLEQTTRKSSWKWQYEQKRCYWRKLR